MLQNKIEEGWKNLLASQQYEDLRAFPLFLDGMDEFHQIHRKKIPYPPHEFAARTMGIPFMETVSKLGLYMSHWFSGDFYDSEEIDEHNADVGGEDIHSRVFHLTLSAPTNELRKISTCSSTCFL